MRHRNQRRTQEFVVVMSALVGAFFIFVGIAGGMIPV